MTVYEVIVETTPSGKPFKVKKVFATREEAQKLVDTYGIFKQKARIRER